MSLRQQIAAVRRRLRRLVLLYGLSYSLAVTLAALIVAGCVDYLLRLHDEGLRVMLSVGVATAAVWSGYAYLLRHLRAPLRDVDLAQRVARSLPGLDDRLSSAVEFLSQAPEDPAAGSLALRQAVIAEASTRAAGLDFRRVLDAKPALRGLTVLLLVVVSALILFARRPELCRTALLRLALPWGNTVWPQTTHLTYRRVVRQVARGQAFEVEVLDARGRSLPAEVLIHYRLEGPGGSVAQEQQAMRYLAGAMVARRENVVRPFAYRVEGGDDHRQPWIEVEVVDPPAVESLDVRLFPPDYTGWPATESPREIRALVGTRIEFSGTSTKPLSGGTLTFGDGRGVPLGLAEERRFRAPIPGAAPLIVEKSGSYWFTLVDRQGLSLRDAERWEIRALPDAPPSVVLEQPAADVYVVPGGSVPLRVVAKDDLAVRSIGLKWARSTSGLEKEQSLPEPLYNGPPRASAATSGPQRAVDYRWNLAPMSLQAGEIVVFHAVAADYRGAEGRSPPRRLNVITPEELLERIAARQALILAELTRVLAMQRESRSQVAALAIRLAELGRLDPLDVDHLQAAALAQRQVARTLTSRGDGLTMHVLSVMADLENNRLDQPDLRRRMDWLLAELGRVEQEFLLPLDGELTAAIKAAQVAAKSPADPLLSRALAVAGAAQDQAIAALEGLLTQLGKWDHYRRFHREVSQLARDQEELAGRMATLARQTLGRELGDLAPQQSAELRTRAREQLDLALRLEHLLDQMRQAAAALGDRDAAATETLAEALDEAQRGALAAQMRQVRDQVEANRMGQALPGQKQLTQALRDLAEILAGRRQQELVRLAKKLDAAQQELDALSGRQANLVRQMNEAATAEAWRALSAPQNALGELAEELGARLSRWLANRAAKSTTAAAGHMRQAGVAAAQAGAAEARRQATEAQRRLTEAQAELRARRAQVQAELLAEQAARLEDAARHLHNQQQQILAATLALDAEPTHPASQVADLARRERALREEATQRSALAAGPVYRWALAGAAGLMQRAADALDAHQTGPATQTAQRQALARLALLLQCFQPDQPAAAAAGPAGGEGGPSGTPPPEGLLSATEIKLLKLLQEALNVRTQELAHEDARKEPIRAQYQGLGEEQGRLAELLLEMLRAGAAEKKTSEEKR